MGVGTWVIYSSLPRLVYQNRIVEHLIGGRGVGTGVINSSPLPLVYHNRIVEHLIGGEGGGDWGD